MTDIEDQLAAVEKSLDAVGVLLKEVPTKTDFEKLTQRVDEVEGIAKSADSGIGDLEDELGENTLSELIKSAVTTAVKDAVEPLEKRIKELEDSPVVKGVQDFDLAKLAKTGGKEEPPKEVDVMKGIIHVNYPELDRGVQ